MLSVMWIPFSPEPFGLNGCKIRQVCQAWFSVHFRVAVRYARCAKHGFPYIFKHCLWPGGSRRLSQGCPDVVPRSLVWPSLASGRQRVVQPVGSLSWGPCPSPGDRILVPRTLSGRCPYVVRTLSGAHVQVWGVTSWPQNVFQTLSLRYVL